MTGPADGPGRGPAPDVGGRPGPALDLDDLVAEARAGLRRPSPAEAARAVAARGALLVDIRPEAQRRREGEIPGAVIIDRNVLEWRLAPGSEHRVPELRHADQAVILFCSQGYASSLAAASLQRLGLRGATDLDGGFLAWAAAGLPAVPYEPHRPRIDRTAPVRHRDPTAAEPAAHPA
jgi:rhodanese-related sulfurtransferase